MILELPHDTEQLISSQAQKQGISIEEFIIASAYEKALQMQDDDGYFDLERMKQAIGETDEKGRAKHTLTLPQGLSKEQLHVWLSENIPAHLASRA